MDFHRGAWRIQGSLAVSRGIGDSHLKQWVIAEPDTTVFPIEPEHDFLILASDGLWDKVCASFCSYTAQLHLQIMSPFCGMSPT